MTDRRVRPVGPELQVPIPYNLPPPTSETGGFRLPISASQPTNWPSRSCLELVWRMVPNSRLTTSVRGPGCPVTNGLVSDGFQMAIPRKMRCLWG